MFNLALPDALFPSLFWWIANTGVLTILSVFVYKSRAVFFRPSHHTQQSIALVLSFTLSIIWLMRAQLLENLYLHFIGASLAFLLLGLPLAGLALAVVLMFTNITRQIPMEIWGAQYILAVLLPLVLSWLLHRSVARVLPKRVFAFIFVHGFFVTAAVMMATVFINLLILNQLHIISLDVGNQVFWISPILLGWGEAFMTGMMTALITVYRPDWWHRETLFKDV